MTGEQVGSHAVSAVGRSLPVRDVEQAGGPVVAGVPRTPWRTTVVTLSGPPTEGHAPEAPPAPAGRRTTSTVPSFEVGPAAGGWTCTGDERVFRYDLGTGAALEARVAFTPSDGSGRALLAELGAHETGPLGAPRVELLPDELGDGLVVSRFVAADDGSLSLRLDIARTVEDVDVVVCSGPLLPEQADDAITAMVLLLVAMEAAS